MTWLMFVRDRLLYILCGVVIIGLAVGMFLLESARYPRLVEPGTIYYYILLALLAIATWLAADYIRQRYYFKQMKEALGRSDDLEASMILKTAATKEQRLALRLLVEQHKAYLDSLSGIRRQQELHNHFIMQWVHHMKTPVSVIDLQMQEARQAVPLPEPEQKALIESAQEETDKLARGLEMMLHTARLEKFEMDLRIRRSALHDLIRGAINAHKRLCIRYSIFPRVQGEAWVETDEKWLTVVLGQLISNAVKYSKRKPGTKTLLFRITGTADGGTMLEVVDDGIGIASHDLPRVFDPFFTGENGRMTGESTGMGLYLAKQVCSNLGHGLFIESALGKGTTVTIGFKPQGIHNVTKL